MTEYFTIERKITTDASPAAVAAHITDFRAWVAWSPWEKLDPDLRRTYSGPARGVGARYEWSGNRKAGAGNMEVTTVSPQAVDVDVNFTKPFKSAAKTTFVLVPAGSGTRIIWRMLTPKTPLTRALGLFMKWDKSIGADLEQGLLELRRAAESDPPA
ncbi:MAG: SRPBCC family protein [Candidatus Nanopelagicales bacterium]